MDMLGSRRVLTFLFTFGVCLLIGAGAFLWLKWGKRYEVKITEAQIKEKLDEKFPFNKTFFLILQVNLSNPHVLLEEGSDRIRFGADIETNVRMNDAKEFPGPLRGSVSLSGVVRYQAPTAEFFLDSPKVESLQIQGIPEKWSGKVQMAAEKGIAEVLERAPIYRLNALDLKQAAVKMVLRDVKVQDKTLHITLGVG